MKLFDPARSDLNLLSISLLIWGLGESLFLIFQPLYLQELGADPVKIGVILSGGLLVMALAQIPVGIVADRFGRRFLLFASWGLGFVAALIMGIARSLTWFVVGLLIYNLIGAVVGVMNSYISHARGDWSVGRAVTYVLAFFNAGSLIGPLVGGVLAERFGLRSIYLIGAATFFVSTILVLFVSEQPIIARRETPSVRSLLNNRRFLGMIAMLAVVTFCSYLPMPLTANFLKNERGVALASIGTFGSLVSLSGILFNAFLGQLKPDLVYLIGQLCMVVASALFFKCDGLVWFGAAYFLSTGSRLIGTISPAVIQPMVHEGQIGLAFGILEAGRNLALMSAPLLAGWLYSIQPSLVYPVAIVAGLLMTVIFNRFYRAQRFTAPEEALSEKIAETAS
ncbi:MAG TPA: MFS transporter [Anaerolineaceae bacterium]|nr:MFS transporter [Anaerolineaceae bacterium]